MPLNSDSSDCASAKAPGAAVLALKQRPWKPRARAAVTFSTSEDTPKTHSTKLAWKSLSSTKIQSAAVNPAQSARNAQKQSTTAKDHETWMLCMQSLQEKLKDPIARLGAAHLRIAEETL